MKYGGVTRAADSDMSVDKVSKSVGSWSSMIYCRRHLGGATSTPSLFKSLRPVRCKFDRFGDADEVALVDRCCQE